MASNPELEAAKALLEANGYTVERKSTPEEVAERQRRSQLADPCSEVKWQDHAGDRVCDWCGSWHPDDYFEFLKTVDGIERYVEPTDKGYKFYVHKPGGGAIKFYTNHTPPARFDEFKAATGEAVRITREARKARGG